MVVESGFRVELVDANSKIPYKEHTKDGKTYAEVEPDAEYFVSLQKIAALPADHSVAKIYVDDQCLGWQWNKVGRTIDQTPTYFGLYHRFKGVESSRALKIVRPRIVVTGKTEHSGWPLLFGTVTVKIYKGSSETFKRVVNGDLSYSVLPTTVKVARPVPGPVATKNFRSGEGTFLGPGMGCGSSYSYWKCETLVTVLNLHYCSALGLRHVKEGRSEPEFFYTTFHHMVTEKRRPCPIIPIVTPKRIRRSSTLTVDGTPLRTSAEYCDLFDLYNLPSDGEDDDSHN